MASYEHLAKFRPVDLAIHETEFWIVSLRPKQVTLGSCVILLKRDVPSLAVVAADEAGDLINAIAWFETRSKAFSSPDKFNYVAAMMKDPFVHFHAFPRFEATREWGGETWPDQSWPAVIEFRDVETSAETLQHLRQELRDQTTTS